MTTPVSASRPAKAMMPTHTATLMLYPSQKIAANAPTSEKGTASMTMAVLTAERVLR